MNSSKKWTILTVGLALIFIIILTTIIIHLMGYKKAFSAYHEYAQQTLVASGDFYNTPNTASLEKLENMVAKLETNTFQQERLLLYPRYIFMLKEKKLFLSLSEMSIALGNTEDYWKVIFIRGEFEKVLKKREELMTVSSNFFSLSKSIEATLAYKEGSLAMKELWNSLGSPEKLTMDKIKVIYSSLRKYNGAPDVDAPLDIIENTIETLYELYPELEEELKRIYQQ